MYREYFTENGEEVELDKLKSEDMSKESYSLAHKSLPIACHDVFIEYGGGILLVKRDNHPAKGELWPIGGRIRRGIPMEESLREKVKVECGLEISGLEFVGIIRHFFKSDPFGHGRGVDTPTFIYFSKGKGELNLDELHSNPKIIKSENYDSEFRNSLHPCVRDFMDVCIKKLENEKN